MYVTQCICVCGRLFYRNLEQEKWRDDENGNEPKCKIKFNVLSIRWRDEVTECTFWRTQRIPDSLPLN